MTAIHACDCQTVIQASTTPRKRRDTQSSKAMELTQPLKRLETPSNQLPNERGDNKTGNQSLKKKLMI